MHTLLWDDIETVLLDMDGTLLDLHFDNHFWLQHLPKKLAARDGISVEQAQQWIRGEYQKVMGQIQWYCLDFWAEKLNMDIVEAKREIEYLISMRPDTVPFLDALKASGRQVYLVTNAHPDSLSLKIEKTALNHHIDTLYSTHSFGVTKESQKLWQALQHEVGFDRQKTLFVDDSLNILDAAAQFGIKYTLAVKNPDSKQPDKDTSGYAAVSDYRDLIPDILAHSKL